MVHARYCASYPKQPCVKHEANMWCPYCMMSLCSGTFYFFLSCPVCCSNHSPEWYLWYADFSKALSRLSSSGDYKRTRQGALAVLLLYLYKYNVVHATTMCLPHVLLLIHHVFSLRPSCFLHMPWCHTLNLCCTCAHHVYTMRNPCLLTSFLTLTPI